MIFQFLLVRENSELRGAEKLDEGGSQQALVLARADGSTDFVGQDKKALQIVVLFRSKKPWAKKKRKEEEGRRSESGGIFKNLPRW